MQNRFRQLLVLMVIALMLTGCATTSNPDPLESVNRGVYKFNNVTDTYFFKPVASTYKAVTPSPIRKGVNNFFNNLQTLTTVVNDILQLKFSQAFTDAGRFVINTTFGIGGLIDVASMDNIERRVEDFGQTLGHYGIDNGPYLVLPFLGPSTLRDFTGLVVDTASSDPISYLHNTDQIRAHNQTRFAQFTDRRVILLDATDIADSASLDPYAFTRDGYLQRRAGLVQDNLVPLDLIRMDDDAFEPADEDAEAYKAMSENRASNQN